MSKGNTNTTARTIKPKKRQSSGGNFFVYLLILLLILCLGALVYFAIKYNNAQRVKVVETAKTAEQRLLVKQLANQLPLAASGDLEMMGKVESDAKRISTLMQEQLNGTNGSTKPTGTMLGSLRAVSSKWQSLSQAQKAVMAKEPAISGISFYIPEALGHSENIEDKLKIIKKGLIRKDQSNRLLNSTERLSELVSQIDKSMLRLNTGAAQVPDEKTVSSFAGLVDQFKGAKSAMLQLADSSRGNVDIGGMANAVMGTSDEIDNYENYISSIAASVNEYSDAKKELGEFTAKANALEVDLLSLSDEESEVQKSELGIDYLTLLGILAALAFLLLLLVMFLIITSQRRSNREARKLQIDAETRTKSDQEAILRLMDDLADLSDGDLTIEAQVTEDFTGAIADSVNFTVESMREMVGTIIESSSQIESATEDTKQISAVMEKASIEQSRRITDSSDTTRSMSQSLNDIAENTDSSVEIARASVEIAQDGRNRVRQTIENMNSLRENIQSTSKRIKRLGESSQEIGDIVEIIKGIADQTNVLALNAAIQATGAGEAGRGFAVVADEVQQLAERSSNASKRIETIVKTIQTDASEAVASMEESTKQVVASANVTEEAGVSLDKIENVSQSLAKLIINVSQETKKAAEMASGVSDSMTSLTKLNQSTTRDVERAVASVDNLRELSNTLKDSVSGFRLPRA